MASLQEALGSIVAETRQTAASAGQQVDALRNLSTVAMRDAASLFHRMEEQGRSVASSTQDHTKAMAEASRALEVIEDRLAGAMESRRAGLEQVLEAIHGRTEDVESITRSFTGLVEDSLRAAEMRARQVGTVLTEATGAAATSMGEQFDLLRATTGKERERTAQALRASYEQLSGEIAQAFGSATDRFRETAAEMRTLASQVQSELDDTRAELRRGVLEIPRETQESTAAMRRVVADQIKALNELSALVRRSETGLDVSARAEPEQPVRRAVAERPAPQPTRTPEPRPPEARPQPAPRPAYRVESVRQEPVFQEPVQREAPRPEPAVRQAKSFSERRRRRNNESICTPSTGNLLTGMKRSFIKDAEIKKIKERHSPLAKKLHKQLSQASM